MKAAALFVALLSAVPAGLWAQASEANAGSSAPALNGMRVYLLESRTGTLSDQDALDPKHAGLWNSFAGPHGANAALVLVEVSGPPSAAYTGHFGPQTRYSVRLVALETGRAKHLLDQTQGIPVLNEQGKTYLGFLIHQGGCKPVRLTATIVGSRSGKPLEKLLPFACGE